MQPTLADIQNRLAARRGDLFRRYPIRTLGIFGSFAREEAQPESDIDILVEFSKPVGFEIADLAIELEALLEHKVDLVSRGAISERLLPYVRKDLIDV